MREKLSVFRNIKDFFGPVCLWPLPELGYWHRWAAPAHQIFLALFPEVLRLSAATCTLMN